MIAPQPPTDVAYPAPLWEMLSYTWLGLFRPTAPPIGPAATPFRATCLASLPTRSEPAPQEVHL